mmetsp:Transcript_14099/g.33273  ORF Transcript_14099/g.33273 Transcript_14099/m.33273 type:complete len:268 (+) Transcript_14099:473-1276(+)
MKVKRGREEPCFICGHYHDYEGGEPCSVCGHRLGSVNERMPLTSAFPSEVIQEFLFLGSYDNASRNELLKAMGVKYILNCVPTCQVLFKNSFTYHTVSTSPPIFEECNEFIDAARRDNSKILVHCMTGISRSASVVVAYIMKLRNWRLAESLKWVKDRRPCVHPNAEAMQHLLQWERELFGSVSVALDGTPIACSSPTAANNGLWGHGKFETLARAEGVSTPTFACSGSGQLFDRQGPALGGGFVFGAGRDGGRNPSGKANGSSMSE